jgi:hypothetical protein
MATPPKLPKVDSSLRDGGRDSPEQSGGASTLTASPAAASAATSPNAPATILAVPASAWQHAMRFLITSVHPVRTIDCFPFVELILSLILLL